MDDLVKMFLRKVAYKFSITLRRLLNEYRDSRRWLPRYLIGRAIQRRTRERDLRSFSNIRDDSFQDKLFISLSQYIAAPERLEMLSVAYPSKYSGIKKSGIAVRVLDASDAAWAEQAKSHFAGLPGINLQYQCRPALSRSIGCNFFNRQKSRISVCFLMIRQYSA